MKWRPPVDRFLEKVEWSDDRYQGTRCLVWTAGRSSAGYGNFGAGNNRSVRAHRWLYERWVGPIPEGLVLDHLCRNRACVNPAHLEPVTDRVNILRGEGPTAKKAKQTHCKHGHEFTPENTYLRPDGRQCRECKRAGRAEYRRRRRLRPSPPPTSPPSEDEEP